MFYWPYYILIQYGELKLYNFLWKKNPFSSSSTCFTGPTTSSSTTGGLKLHNFLWKSSILNFFLVFYWPTTSSSSSTGNSSSTISSEKNSIFLPLLRVLLALLHPHPIRGTQALQFPLKKINFLPLLRVLLAQLHPHPVRGTQALQFPLKKNPFSSSSTCFTGPTTSSSNTGGLKLHNFLWKSSIFLPLLRVLLALLHHHHPVRGTQALQFPLKKAPFCTSSLCSTGPTTSLSSTGNSSSTISSEKNSIFLPLLRVLLALLHPHPVLETQALQFPLKKTPFFFLFYVFYWPTTSSSTTGGLKLYNFLWKR